MTNNTAIERSGSGIWSASSIIPRDLTTVSPNWNELVVTDRGMICCRTYLRLESSSLCPTTECDAPNSTQKPGSFKRLESVKKCVCEKSNVSPGWLNRVESYSSSLSFSNPTVNCAFNFSSSFAMYNDSLQCTSPISSMLCWRESGLRLDKAIQRFKICSAINTADSSVQFISSITLKFIKYSVVFHALSLKTCFRDPQP